MSRPYQEKLNSHLVAYTSPAEKGTRSGLDRERAGVSGASPRLRDAGTGLARHHHAQRALGPERVRSRKMDLRQDLEFFAVEEMRHSYMDHRGRTSFAIVVFSYLLSFSAPSMLRNRSPVLR
jgi:hypothetical protein